MDAVLTHQTQEMPPVDDGDLVVLPPDSVDVGTQRCRLGPAVMEELGLKLGSPLLILLPRGSCLCTAWPRSDLANGYLQFQTTCAAVNLITYEALKLSAHPTPQSENSYTGFNINLMKLQHLQRVKIKPLTCPRLKRLCVKVLVQSSETEPIQYIQELAKELLIGLYVHEKHLVSVARAGTQIQFIQVENVNSGSHKAGLVTAETHLDLSSVQTVQKYRQTLRKTPSVPLGGVDEVLASLKEMLTVPLLYPGSLKHLGLPCPRGALLVGPPGVGKTQLVRNVVQRVGAALVTINGPVVVGSRPGESEENLRRAFDRARAAALAVPCVLFIDEIDALCPRRSVSGSAPENRIVAQLLTLMDGIGSDESFIIIAATNQPDTLDPALRRPGRFDREVVVGVPTLQQRFRILQCVSRGLPLSSTVDLQSVAEMTTGYVGADLSALCREAALQAVLHTAQGGGEEPNESVGQEHFDRALRLVPPSCLRSSVGVADFQPVSWERIGGLEDVKLKLKQSIEWPMKFPEALMRMGVRGPRGVLLYGPPGCAKTTLVKAAASASHCSFLTLSGAQLYSPYVGDSERTLSQLFQQARACSPSIVFLDEIDSMVGSRGDGGCRSGVQAQVLSVLLNELDGVGYKTTERRAPTKTVQIEGELQETAREKRMELQEMCNKDVMIVAATNRPDTLDSALLRPGRLDHIIYVPPPDPQARLAILQLHTQKIPLNSDVSLMDLATQTNLFSGADLENLCKEAALLALNEEGMDVSSVQQKYFLKALERVSPSLTAHQLLQYQHLFSTRLNCS